MIDMGKEEELLEAQAWHFDVFMLKGSAFYRICYPFFFQVDDACATFLLCLQELKKSISDVSTDASLSRHSLSEAPEIAGQTGARGVIHLDTPGNP